MKKKLIEDPKYIIGIDSSTKSIAFSIFHEKNLIKYGKINFKGSNVFIRAGDASRKCAQLFKEFPSGLIVIEKAVFVNNRNTAMELSFMQGAILGSVQHYNSFEIKRVPPQQWQHGIGNGPLTDYRKQKIMQENPGHVPSFYRARQREFRKQRTIAIVNKLYGLCVSDDDVADAIGIGHFALENWRIL